MKNIMFIVLMMFSFACSTLSQTQSLTRNPASAEVKELIQTEERQGFQGCCSHHGGISHCSSGSLYCNDGWVSGCGC